MKCWIYILALMYFETGFYFYTPPTFIIVNAPSLYRGVHVYETTQTGSCVKTNKQLKKHLTDLTWLYHNWKKYSSCFKLQKELNY